MRFIDTPALRIAFEEHGPAHGPAAILLHGADDGVANPVKPDHAGRFTGPYREETVPGAGHNLPQERPDIFAQAVPGLV